MTHVFFSKSLVMAFHKILFCFQIRKMNHRTMTTFSVPRKHCEYTFNGALLQNCWEPSPTKLTEKRKDLQLRADVELINVPYTGSSEKQLSSQHNVKAWPDEYETGQKSHSAKGAGRRTTVETGGASRWTWLSHTVGGEGRSQVELTLGKEDANSFQWL